MLLCVLDTKPECAFHCLMLVLVTAIGTRRIVLANPFWSNIGANSIQTLPWSPVAPGRGSLAT